MKKIAYLVLIAVFCFSCVANKNSASENVNINSQNSSIAGVGQSGDNSSQNTASAMQPEQDSPDAVIKDLYKTHEKDNGKIINSKNRTLIDNYFDKNLADLIWKDLTTHKDEVGVIDFDLFYNSQDPDIKNLMVNAPKVTGEKATVSVTFDNSGRKETLIYSLLKQKSSWKISDINYGGGQTLLKLFKDNAQTVNNATTEDGNFEGTYQVGDTTATVKPIKMAFELKWAKGSGTMTFFYDGEDGATEHIYSSEDGGKGKDSFIFDDESMTTGKFVRADGKEMAVRKIK